MGLCVFIIYYPCDIPTKWGVLPCKASREVVALTFSRGFRSYKLTMTWNSDAVDVNLLIDSMNQQIGHLEYGAACREPPSKDGELVCWSKLTGMTQLGGG